MNPFRYDVSLRIRHPNITPEEICKVLGMTARHQWTAGASRKTPKGTPIKGTYDSTYCSFRLDHPTDMRLADFLSQCNKRFRPYQEFFKKIRSTGGSLDYFVGWYSNASSGELFSANLLSELADLKIDLGLDVYVESNPLRNQSKKVRVAKKKSRTRKTKKKRMLTKKI